MGLSYEAALQLFRLGRFRDILAQTDCTRVSITRLASAEHRLLLAHALAYTGDLSVARTVAEAELSQTPTSRCRRSLILGLVDKRQSDIDSATKHFHQAIQFACQANDLILQGWAHLNLFRLLSEGQPKQNLTPMIGEARRLVIQAADPHLVVYLHLAVAIVETQVGHFDEATRHLSTARSLLERHPNAWLEQNVEVASTSLACLQSDFVAAASHSSKAKELGEITGHEVATTALELNNAYAALWLGKIAHAFEKLESLKNAGMVAARLSALETLARLHLSLNRLNECEQSLGEIAATADREDASRLYPVRWGTVVKAKLLLRRNNPQGALIHLQQEANGMSEMHDVPLLVALALVEAEAYAVLGRFAEAAGSLMKAGSLDLPRNTEVQGQYLFACGRVLGLQRNELALLFESRAQRLWNHYRNVAALLEVNTVQGPPWPIANYDKDPKLFSRDDRPRLLISPTCAPVATTDVIANVLDLAGTPALLAAELRQLIVTLGCEAFASVQESKRPPRQDADGEHSGYVIPLGTEGDRTIALTYREADDPARSIAIADLARITRSALALERLRRDEQARAAVWPTSEDEETGSVYVDEQMVSLVRAARRVAPVNVSVLITGETGTGKEVLARTIHAASTRAQAIFLPFNCSACPRDMIDAQLFGHRRGAFTGALEHAPGVIRSSAGGTLFLDEIGDAPLDIQPKLLRFLESGEIHPIGEAQPVRADVRVIAATNVDLDAAVAAGRFREDLFYRLNIVRLHIPPLRERRVEIPVLAQRYLQQYAAEYDKGNLRLAEETMEYLLLYRWPGNVRQLANEMRRLAALAEHDAVLMPEHLAPEIAASRRTVPASQRQLDSTEVVVRIDQPMAAAVEHLERAMVMHALNACGGRVEGAAQRLGVSRKGLYLKRQRFGLEIHEPQARTA